MNQINRRRFFLTLTAFAATVPLSYGIARAQDAPKAVTHRILAQDRGHVVLLDENGAVVWEAPCPGASHDIGMLPNGHVLIQTAADNVVELDRDKNIVWKWQGKPLPGVNDHVEIHAFQRLPDGNTLIAETSNRRLIEVKPDGTIVRSVPLTIDHPNAHRDTRRVRKTPQGTYLACHEADGTVREYDATGKVVWSYTLDLNGKPRTPSHQGHGTEVFNALRLPSGNTLIAGGNNNRVFEIEPSGKVVWSIDQDELPGIHLCWVTGLEVLPNGNIVFGNTHAGENQPQLIEVTRDKKVVWMLKDWKALGNDTASAILADAPRGTLR